MASSQGPSDGNAAADSSTPSPLRRSRRQQNAAPELEDDVMEDVPPTVLSSHTAPYNADGRAGTDDRSDSADYAGQSFDLLLRQLNVIR